MKEMYLKASSVPKFAVRLNDVFKYLRDNYPNSRITTWGNFKKTCKDEKTLGKYKRISDDCFFDIDTKRTLCAKEMQLRFGIFHTTDGSYIQ